MSKIMKKRGGFVGLTLLVGLIFFVLGLVSIPRFPMGPFKLYADMTDKQKLQTIPFEVLSTESLHPFVYSNAIAVSPGEVISSTQRFNTVRDCLVPSEQDVTEPDLRMVNWDALYSNLDINVCMWRVFNSLGNWESGKDWMEFQGFKIEERSEAPYLLAAGYSTSKRPALTRGIWKPYGHSLGVVWEPSPKFKQHRQNARISIVNFQSGFK